MEQISAARLLDRIREARNYARQKERESFSAHEPSDSSYEALVAAMDGATHRVVADVLDVIAGDGESAVRQQ
ncbi:hypothetical protein [Streptomyces cyaneofuscatus]|uniref:hypothetical protein n=1 Tax=Streptomyces cyaneofuscatus TaxID=66883 RepID=UPI003437DCDE